MAKQSYLVRTQVTITRQEGDTGSIPLVVPALYDMSIVDTIIFKAVTVDDELIFDKEWDSGETEISLEIDSLGVQIVYIHLDGDELTGHAADDNKWEMQCTIIASSEINTIGKGPFVIESEIITEGL